MALERMLETFKQTIEEVLLNEDGLYDNRLIYPATEIDPPEHERCCLICDMPDKEHSPYCLISKILETVERFR